MGMDGACGSRSVGVCRNGRDPYRVSERSFVQKETEIALKNYDWLVRNRGLDDVTLHFESHTIAYGDGGAGIDELLRPGFTPAT